MVDFTTLRREDMSGTENEELYRFRRKLDYVFSKSCVPGVGRELKSIEIASSNIRIKTDLQNFVCS